MAIFTDGSCLNNGNAGTQGGYAFVFNSDGSDADFPGTISAL